MNLAKFIHFAMMDKINIIDEETSNSDFEVDFLQNKFIHRLVLSNLIILLLVNQRISKKSNINYINISHTFEEKNELK